MEKTNKNKIEEFKNNIGTLKASVKKLEPEYNKNSKLFHRKRKLKMAKTQETLNFA